jgi:hypothetical protein
MFILLLLFLFFVFLALYWRWNHCSHPIFLLSFFFFLDKVHRYMRWLWCRADHIVGLLRINSRISILVVLNDYFGLCFLFLSNPFATLISTIPWWVTKPSVNWICFMILSFFSIFSLSDLILIFFYFEFF